MHATSGIGSRELNFVSTVLFDLDGVCTSGNKEHTKVAWVHYLVCMLFDFLCLSVATTHLVLDNFRAGGMDGLAAALFREGLVYFVALTGRYHPHLTI